MESLFIDYHTLLRQHGLSWLVTKNQKVVVQHVLGAIKPSKLRQRLKSDLVFSKHALKNDFNAFFEHARKISKLQLVDSGALSETPSITSFTAGKQKEAKTKNVGHTQAKNATKGKKNP